MSLKLHDPQLGIVESNCNTTYSSLEITWSHYWVFLCKLLIAVLVLYAIFLLFNHISFPFSFASNNFFYVVVVCLAFSIQNQFFYGIFSVHLLLDIFPSRNNTRLQITQMVKDTSAKLKLASEIDHRVEVSVSFNSFHIFFSYLISWHQHSTSFDWWLQSLSDSSIS